MHCQYSSLSVPLYWIRPLVFVAAIEHMHVDRYQTLHMFGSLLGMQNDNPYDVKLYHDMIKLYGLTLWGMDVDAYSTDTFTSFGGTLLGRKYVLTQYQEYMRDIGS